MKLHIRRDQKQEKGLFGGNKGVNFSLYCKAAFASEESQLIEKYKLGDQLIAEYKVKGIDTPFFLTVSKLGEGFSTELKQLGELQDLEDEIEESCKKLKTYLEVASTFGGERVVEI